MNNKYYLSHKNVQVAIVEIDEIGQMTNVERVIDHKMLPPAGKQSVKDLKRWWSNRAIPIGQDGFKELLELNHCDSSSEYLIKNLGLSLNDCYWVNPFEKKYDWEEVNLFDNYFATNELDEMVSNISNKESTTQGQLFKRWVIEENNRYLEKGNKGDSCQQSINEVFAGKIHESQGWSKYIPYTICSLSYKNKEHIGCKCRNFCNGKVEFFSSNDIFLSEKMVTLDYETQFIRNCVVNGMQQDKIKRFLDYQILTDFLITNEDRHRGNFGILRDADSLEFIDMAYIFDSGNSMFWNKEEKLPESRNELGQKTINSFKISEKGLLETVDDFNIIHLDSLPDVTELRKLYAIDRITSEDRYEKIFELYDMKKIMLKELQQGKRTVGNLFD